MTAVAARRMRQKFGIAAELAGGGRRSKRTRGEWVTSSQKLHPLQLSWTMAGLEGKTSHGTGWVGCGANMGNFLPSAKTGAPLATMDVPLEVTTPLPTPRLAWRRWRGTSETSPGSSTILESA